MLAVIILNMGDVYDNDADQAYLVDLRAMTTEVVVAKQAESKLAAFASIAAGCSEDVGNATFSNSTVENSTHTIISDDGCDRDDVVWAKLLVFVFYIRSIGSTRFLYVIVYFMLAVARAISHPAECLILKSAVTRLVIETNQDTGEKETEAREEVANAGVQTDSDD